MKLKILISILSIVVLLTLTTTSRAVGLYYILTGGVRDTNATTTTSYLTGGTGTTTKTLFSDGYEQVSYFVTLASSTTPPTLCWKNEYSPDGTRWYGENKTYASSSISIQDAVENCYTYASTTGVTPQVVFGADGKEIGLRTKIAVKTLDSQMVRTIFYIRPTVAARLGVESVLKNEVVLTK